MLDKIFGFKKPRKLFKRFMAEASVTFYEEERTKRNLTPDEEEALKNAKQLTEMDDVEIVVGEARWVKENLEKERAIRNLDSSEKAMLKLVTSFFDEKDEKVKLKLYNELLKRT